MIDLTFAFGLLVLCVACCLYFLPSIIACLRHLADRRALFVINLFFGWTLIGWVACLGWSVAGTVRVEA